MVNAIERTGQATVKRQEKSMALSILCDEESRQNVKDAMEQQHPDVKLEGEEKKGGPYWTLMYNSDDITVGMTAMINGASSAVLV